MEGVEQGSGAPGIAISWIPLTPAKAILSRAGKVVAAKLPVIELDELESEYPPGFEPEVQLNESEEDYPPGFEPKFRSAKSDLLEAVRFGVLESTRREDGKLVARDSSGGEGYGASPMQSVHSVAGFEMSPFLSLLTKANADGVQGRCESVSIGHAGPVPCSCLDCNVEHHGPSSLVCQQDDSFLGTFSASNTCEDLGKQHLPLDQWQFSKIMPPWTVAGAITKETSPPLAPVTPDKAGGLQRRNTETENLSACDQTNHARGSSEEHIKEPQQSTAKNQVLDKGDTQGFELKTPLKKERRKKHRPKVVKEVKLGMTPSRKQTASKTGASRDDSKPKRKYVRRRAAENAHRALLEGRHDSTNLETAQSQPAVKPRQRNLKDDAEGEANANPNVEYPTRKRKYVRWKKGVDDANTTTTPAENSTRKSCRRGLNFELEGPTKEDKATEFTTECSGAGNNKNDHCPNLVAACSPFLFPRRKRTRTRLSPSTVSDKAKLSSDYKDEMATGTKRDGIPSMTETGMSVQGKFEYFQDVVSTGEAAAAAAAMAYSFSYRSHCNSIQAHRYWPLSLSNLQNKITVNDGCYSILESDHSTADFVLTRRPVTAHIQDPRLFPSHDDSSLISFCQESSIHFPGSVRPTGFERACSVQVTGTNMSSEMSNNRIPAGNYPEFVRNSSSGIKDLVKQLRKLNLNKERAVRKDQTHRLVASYDLMYRQDNALVLHKPAGMIVPYGNPPNEPKKRRQRVKVELDDETNKVWQLLLKNIDNKGIDGTDEEKAKWWEEERAVFQGRADSFIARMRLVQGDRRFSLWKGSVLDSVVGVFLTQNVSDHLSSSAFMSLAARYPLKTGQNSSSTEATDGKEVNAEGKSMTSFTKLLNLANDYIPNGLFIREKIGDVQSEEHSPSPNEELKHDFIGLLHHYGETLESIPSSQCSAVMEDKISTREHKSLGKKEKQEFDWDSLRKEAEARRRKTETTPDTTDSLDWESVRRAPANEVASIIRKRGMNYRLSQRIKDFLDRVVRDHGGLDLEWLRDIPPDKAKEYLLSFQGLGPKSVDCVRLLTLHHLAFPVDINVGRIAVRLGWVPLQPLPESLQLHLLEMYPILESIQQYLWPRLCKLDQGTLYELHYQMITFGKVFCTKNKPNCNACPMRGECRHFASAFASARLSLLAPEQSSRDCATEKDPCVLDPPELLSLPSLPEKLEVLDIEDLAGKCKRSSCKPIIEEPASPELECMAVLGNDLEESILDFEDDGEIPTIRLNTEEFTSNLQMFMQRETAIQEDPMSKALVAFPPGAASVAAPPLKSHSRLRTEHLVYEIPQGHPLLDGLDKLEPDDPCQYLLAIWNPGETANSIRPPEGGCTSQDGQLCEELSCVSCGGIREANLQIVRGTILIPCRTAMRGSFPLNGTYFQVNEVFADHESSQNPLNVPRSLIWNLPRRTVYCSTSISAIFKGMSAEAIQHCFWRGYVCVRGFDRKTRAPCPLVDRIHFPASKMAEAKTKDKVRAL